MKKKEKGISKSKTSKSKPITRVITEQKEKTLTIYPCFLCKKEVLKGERQYMIGIDKPYANLFVHYWCWRDIQPVSDEKLRQLIKDNVDLIMEIIASF